MGGSMFDDDELKKNLEEAAANAPKPVKGRAPYLIERDSGIVHVYNDSLAQRGDLVDACYNLQGSRDPADADPKFDPRAFNTEANKKVISKPAPRTAADFAAENAELRKKLAEAEARANAATTPAATTPAATTPAATTPAATTPAATTPAATTPAATTPAATTPAATTPAAEGTTPVEEKTTEDPAKPGFLASVARGLAGG